ncbi:MAG: hypothetical protein LBM71_00255 [Elusimicrobiota bacterium]|jgi:hypothetical protein|nr:hypothetical protein [Elusimicrobiota bacterium]
MKIKFNLLFLISVFVFMANTAYAQPQGERQSSQKAIDVAQSEATASATAAATALPVSSTTAPAPAVASANLDGQKTEFKPASKRDPFLSKQEVAEIERARLAEQKRIIEERKRLEAAEKAKRDEIERQKLLQEELKRNPARAIVNKINVEGILGSEAIINGEVKAIGSTVLGAKVVEVSDSSVTFVYKGQRFVKKLPLM